MQTSLRLASEAGLDALAVSVGNVHLQQAKKADIKDVDVTSPLIGKVFDLEGFPKETLNVQFISRQIPCRLPCLSETWQSALQPPTSVSSL